METTFQRWHWAAAVGSDHPGDPGGGGREPPQNPCTPPTSPAARVSPPHPVLGRGSRTTACPDVPSHQELSPGTQLPGQDRVGGRGRRWASSWLGHPHSQAIAQTPAALRSRLYLHLITIIKNYTSSVRSGVSNPGSRQQLLRGEHLSWI